jgi:hypothetical protein
MGRGVDQVGNTAGRAENRETAHAIGFAACLDREGAFFFDLLAR